MVQSQLSIHSVKSTERPSELPSWRGPLFVIGTWRSGTSLLYALLNKHPQVGLMYEADLLVLRPVFWIPGAASRWLARWEFWNQGPNRHGIEASAVPSDIARVQTAVEMTYRDFARQKGALIWGEKSPQLLQSPPARLVRDFPDARFIIIWRDPAAICRSVIRAADEEDSFFDKVGMPCRTLMACRRLKVECDRLLAQGVPVHELHYETLVKDPTAVMADICRFLELPFVPGVASLEGADRSAIYEAKHHTLVKSERIVSSVERLEVLPADLKAKIERYKALWWEQSGGKWPTPPPLQDSNSEKPSFAEGVVDRAVDRCLRMLDSLVLLVYCFAPFWLLKRFREFKRERGLRKPQRTIKLSRTDSSRANQSGLTGGAASDATRD